MLPTRTDPATPIDRTACPSTGGHGTKWYRWRHGCTCPDGLADLNRISRERRSGDHPATLVDALGSRRRLQALAVLGYPGPWLARYFGCTPQHLAKIRDGRPRRVQDHVADMITEGYRRLSGTPCTAARAHLVTAAAARNGYLGPDEWEDPDDPDEIPASMFRDDLERYFARPDQPADAGVPLATLQEMRGLGNSVAAIAERTGLPADTVEDRLQDADTGYRQDRARNARPGRLTDDQIYKIRAEYLQTYATTWNGKQVAARYGKAPCTITAVIHGRTRPELGLSDLTALAPCRLRRGPGPPAKFTDATVYAVRDSYRGGLRETALAARHGISATTAARIVRGKVRPALGLSDLTRPAAAAAGTTEQENAA